MEKKNYALVCYLEGTQKEKVRDLQRKLANITGSHNALEGWEPHITLGSGIIVPENRQEELENSLQSFVQNNNAFNLLLEGFGEFTSFRAEEKIGSEKYVLWIKPLMTSELRALFNTLADSITSLYDTYYSRMKDSDYTPHITLAYGDLTKEGFEKGKEYLSALQFKDTMTISHIALVEYNGNKGTEYKRFYFNKIK